MKDKGKANQLYKIAMNDDVSDYFYRLGRSRYSSNQEWHPLAPTLKQLTLRL